MLTGGGGIRGDPFRLRIYTQEQYMNSQSHMSTNNIPDHTSHFSVYTVLMNGWHLQALAAFVGALLIAAFTTIALRDIERERRIDGLSERIARAEAQIKSLKRAVYRGSKDPLGFVP